MNNSTVEGPEKIYLESKQYKLYKTKAEQNLRKIITRLMILFKWPRNTRSLFIDSNRVNIECYHVPTKVSVNS